MNILYISYLLCGVLLGGDSIASTSTATSDTDPQQSLAGEEDLLGKVKKVIGVNYNSFFSGPGPGMSINNTPGFTGAPSDTGLNFFNYISVKWKTTDNIGVDLQFRNEFVVTNQWDYRPQGQRLGVSGTFLKGESWSLWGALNSDIPIPSIMGQINTQRTLIFDPGMFSFFSYEPKSSKWFLYALLAPRIFFYRDLQAVAIQDQLNGGTKIKPQYDIYLNPSVNYQASEKTSIRMGTTIEYTKFVAFSAPVRNYMPLEFGVKYDFSSLFSVYTYMLTSTPLDDSLRQMQGFGNNSWWQTMSLNVWLSGTLL